jgi:formate dehydrogenase (NADP+) alpha subunit
MKHINILIDNVRIAAREGQTVIDAALDNGIYIPNLCHHPDLKPMGMCRLCIVEIAGRGLTTSCTATVEAGMSVITDNEEINQVRRTTTELISANHTRECFTCKQNDRCGLQKVTSYLGIENSGDQPMRQRKEMLPVDDSDPFFTLDMNKCVLCGICVRTCDELQGDNAIDYINRGPHTIISTFNNQPLFDSACKSCGECVVRCPVGALTFKDFKNPSREVRTICAYCGVGCSFFLGVRGNKIVSVRGDRNGLANKGSLCVKGRFGNGFVNDSQRLTVPLIKKNGKFEESGWEEALDLIAEKFKIYKNGRFACFSSAKCTNEENYVIQKFTRAVMGTNNIDHCARLCHAPSVSGLAQSLGSGAMTNSIDEISGARTIFAIGTNTTWAHPVLALQIKKAVRNGGKLIVANPKRIDLCSHAEIFLQHKPGTDVVLMMGMMRVIVDEGLQDNLFIAERTENLEPFLDSLRDFGLDYVQLITGVDRDKIARAARLYASEKPSSILYAMGITQHSHGTDNVLATSNLALLTGNIGKLSTGVNPLRGQNNVQGACDMGALPNVYPGYQKVADETIRQKFQDAWNAGLSNKIGLTHTEIVDAIDRGEVKALYQVGENPVMSEADSGHIMQALPKLDFFVVQDIFMTRTAQYADVILPAASFAEKSGTFTNTERRVQKVRQAIAPIGQSRADWEITCELARRMGAEGFAYNSAAEIMTEISRLTPIYGGITPEKIEDHGVQWPCPDTDHKGTPFLHGEKFQTPSGRGRFMPLKYIPSSEPVSKEFPLILTTDRSLYHYHTSTMTGRVNGLKLLDSEEFILINPADADIFGLGDRELVRISTRRGSLEVRIKITDICPPGIVSMTFHFENTHTNLLTSPALDPVAKIPETKVAAARIDKLRR